MRNHKLLFAVMMVVLVFALVMGTAFAAQWPTKMINVIVPWAPGGASDLVARTLASEMEKVLGQKISITNTPGAAGAIGTQGFFDAPHDGYTWTGNADGSIVTYQVLETLKQSHKDYESFLAVFNPNVICVPLNSPINDFPQLLAAMKAKTLTVATAGVGSGGHTAVEIFKKYTKVEYRHVPYQGGAPAVTAVVKGEVDMTTQLASEVTEMLRAKQMKAIVAMTKDPLTVDGYGTVPSITKYIKDFPVVGNRFGLFIPKDVPADVKAQITKAFIVAAKSAAIKKFAAERGCQAIALYGTEADKTVNEVASRLTWLLYEAGIAKKSPADFKIPKL